MIRMMKILFLLIVCWIVTGNGYGVFAAVQESPDSSETWSSWRGPTQNGVADPQTDPPTEWSEEKNIKFKTPLVGKGHSTPVVWGNQIFVTSAEPVGKKFPAILDTAPGAHDNFSVSQQHRFLVSSFDRKNGTLVWQKTLDQVVPHEGGHFTGSLASASPVTDGKRVYAFFGSHGLYCLDYQGQLIWKKIIGRMNSKHAHGEGSTPALQDGVLVVNWDHEGQSFVIAIDAGTGEILWKVNRPEVTSWSSPIIVKVDGRYQAVIPGTAATRGYELQTGKVVWQCGGLSNNVVASPVYEDGIVYVGSSYDTQSFLAISLAGAKGDITESPHVLWHRRRHTPYVPSPLVFRSTLYFFRHYQGILYRLDGPSGKEKDVFRLPGLTNIYASPTAAQNRIYIVDRGGRTMVLDHADQPKILALNRLNDSFSASPVAVGNELILRGEKSLYIISAK